MYEVILESISDGVFTVDSRTWKITSFNRAAENITGLTREEAVGMQCSEVFRSSMCEAHCALRETLTTGTPIINKPCYIITAEGRKIPISISTAVIKNSDGTVMGGVETFRDLSEIIDLKKKLENVKNGGDICSHSPSMQKILDLIPTIASSSSTVLIQGETGTGKEVLAKSIHSMSLNKKGPLISVNCGALPDNLLESELFGYKKGAFTGALHDKPGRFALADNGTLFLDEIGEISQTLQIKLLRVLQERVYEPLGGIKSLKTNARIIAATNRNLAELVSEGKFREDLFYRINVLCLNLPPLRNRKNDIPLLVESFIKKFNKLQGKKITGISHEVLSFLMTYEWPGNIRELENIIERAFILNSSGIIKMKHLPEEMSGAQPGSPNRDSIKNLKNIVEADIIEKVLLKNRQNRTLTAKELGIDKSTLYRKMKKLGINFKK